MNGIVIGGILLFLAVITIIVVVVIMNNKKKEPNSRIKNSSSENSSSENSSSENSSSENSSSENSSSENSSSETKPKTGYLKHKTHSNIRYLGWTATGNPDRYKSGEAATWTSLKETKIEITSDGYIKSIGGSDPVPGDGVYLSWTPWTGTNSGDDRHQAYWSSDKNTKITLSSDGTISCTIKGKKWYLSDTARGNTKIAPREWAIWFNKNDAKFELID